MDSWGHSKSAQRVRAAAIVALVGSALPRIALADSPVPSYLGQGFPLERYDPAPAGDRFAWTFDAAPSSHDASVRLAYDVAFQPLRIQAPYGMSVPASRVTYLHVGGSIFPCANLLLSADVPVLVEQRLFVDAPRSGLPLSSPATAPESGDLGDIRLGARYQIPYHLPRLPSGALELAVAVDYWLATGNPQTLTGDYVPSSFLHNRKDILAIAGGTIDRTFEYGASVGYEDRPTFAFGGSAIGGGIPLRLAAGVRGCVDREDLVRGTAELAAERVTPEVAAASRSDFDELMVSGQLIHFLLGGRLSTRVGVGVGVSDAPGVARERALLSLEYAATSAPRDCDE